MRWRCPMPTRPRSGGRSSPPANSSTRSPLCSPSRPRRSPRSDMIAADRAVQRPPHARVLAVDAAGAIADVARARFVDLLHRGDLVVANDAATLPASLNGVHEPSGAPVEVRLAGRASLDADDVRDFTAVVFGAGDFHVRTENRPLPPPLRSGDRLLLGPLTARVAGCLDHPRLVALRFDGTPAAIWEGLARHGRPIQYA